MNSESEIPASFTHNGILYHVHSDQSYARSNYVYLYYFEPWANGSQRNFIVPISVVTQWLAEDRLEDLSESGGEEAKEQN